MGKELIEILVKKRLALRSKISRNHKLVDTYVQRVDSLNTRYEVLRNKLLAEWKEELAKLEYDQQELVRNNEGLKIRLNEVDHKLEKYRVKDENLVMDRWSLDPKYYYLK
jgi:predicted nuclease with TOPRIM domain